MAADYKTLLGLVRELVACAEETPDSEHRVTVGDDLIGRARAAIAPSTPKPPPNDASILHCLEQDDPCCSKHFIKAGRDGVLDRSVTWTCPKCETDWIKQNSGSNIFFWQARPAVLVFRP